MISKSEEKLIENIEKEFTKSYGDYGFFEFLIDLKETLRNNLSNINDNIKELEYECDKNMRTLDIIERTLNYIQYRDDRYL